MNEMEESRKVKKPYGGARCELFNYGRNAVMFTASWTDREIDGMRLTPQGLKIYENLQYQASLPYTEYYQYQREQMALLGIRPGAYKPIDAACAGVWIEDLLPDPKSQEALQELIDWILQGFRARYAYDGDDCGYYC